MDQVIPTDRRTPDKPSTPRPMERMREWEHPQDKDCPRKAKPVFTKPNEVPNRCGRTRNGTDVYSCGEDEWRSKGVVRRFSDGKKEIVEREK